MRIPSQFDDGDVSYGRSGRFDRSMPYRQLFRMTLAMVLLVVVMKAASRQEIYEPFFPATPAVTSGDRAKDRLSENSRGEPSSQTKGRLPPLSPSMIDEARSRLASLRPATQVATCRSLIRFLAGQQKQPLAGIDVAANFSLPDNLSSAQQRSFARAVVSLVIDQTQSRVVDGSVWRTADRDALMLRLLQVQTGVSLVSDRDATEVGVLSLLQQPEVFLGKPVTVAGRLAKAERIRDESNSDPLPTHWKLWIKPTSGVARPIIALVTELPKPIDAIDDSTKPGQNALIRVNGTFVKRLAYRSSIGADLAPVVIGRVRGSDRSKPITAASRPSRSGARGTAAGGFALLGAAVLVGVSIAACLTWRSRSNEKHLQRKRLGNRVKTIQVPDKF